jgi:hypothetical protein
MAHGDDKSVVECLHEAVAHAKVVAEIAKARAEAGVGTGPDDGSAALLLIDAQLALLRSRRGFPAIPAFASATGSRASRYF